MISHDRKSDSFDCGVFQGVSDNLLNLYCFGSQLYDRTIFCGTPTVVLEASAPVSYTHLGHVVGPVKTQFGYHLIKVEKKNEASVAAFDEVKEAIKRNLIQQKQNAAYNAKVQELKEKYLQK